MILKRITVRTKARLAGAILFNDLLDLRHVGFKQSIAGPQMDGDAFIA
jgi:hypothetical protein